MNPNNSHPLQQEVQCALSGGQTILVVMPFNYGILNTCLLSYLCTYLSLCVREHVCATMCVVRILFSSFTRGLQALNFGPQAWWQIRLSNEPCRYYRTYFHEDSRHLKFSQQDTILNSSHLGTFRTNLCSCLKSDRC